MHDRASRELARQWAARGPLARFPKQFYRPAAQIDLDLDSLGLCAQKAERPLLRVFRGWKTKGGDAWREGASWSRGRRGSWVPRRSANWSAEALAGRWKF